MLEGGGEVGAGGGGGDHEGGMRVPVCDVIVSRNVSASSPTTTAPAAHSPLLVVKVVL